MSPGPKTTASASRSIRLGASVPNATVPDALRDDASRNFTNSESERVSKLSCARGVDIANEIRVPPVQIRGGLPDKIQGVIRLLPGNRPPFESEPAFSRNYVLRRAAFDQTNIHGGVWRIETGALTVLQLVGDLLDASKQTCLR